MLPRHVGAGGDLERRDPDARLQAERADALREPFHAVRIEVVALPVAERALPAGVHLHPLDAVGLQMLRDELRVAKLLLLGGHPPRVKPRAPAVDDRVELHAVQLTAKRRVGFQPVERIARGLQQHAPGANALARPHHKMPPVERARRQVERAAGLPPLRGLVVAGDDLPRRVAVLQKARHQRARAVDAERRVPPTANLAPARGVEVRQLAGIVAHESVGQHPAHRRADPARTEPAARPLVQQCAQRLRAAHDDVLAGNVRERQLEHRRRPVRQQRHAMLQLQRLRRVRASHHKLSALQTRAVRLRVPRLA